MGSKQARRRTSRTRLIETLEERRVMSADPLASLLGGAIEQHAFNDSTAEPPALVHHDQRDADFWIDSWSERDIETMLGDVEQTLASAHGATGLTQVRNDYGFIGTGQTVAIIDSGIAYDHYALGGGFGSDYRVVGGWDFTEENDANPYDDGPYGSHGTHVAGIVGADLAGTSNDGVAPGVDLVGLRVFNDAGDGYFSWVENALQWVHENHNTFENPITAVNLSLGTSWNSTSIPSWAMLEEEFAQLEADGVFITVSAGNSFASYNTTGLSYPAASPYVVPVMSVTDNGNLSSFSQRDPSAIGAPGQYIVSTVPDYVGNQNGVTDDFASYSGTSMAAPYVAGASVIVREAMEFVGYSDITQDTIFDHMMATATTFYDAATSLNYKRLDLESAIDALMPSDDYGSTTAAAYNLGTLSGTSDIAGLIGKLDDADYFTFTAAATGTVSFTADTTHELAPVWTASGGSGAVSGAGGETFTFDVVAGQSYTLGLSSSGGIGYYDLSIEAESAFTYVDWGAVTQFQVNDLSNTGETWYRVQASQTGYLTAEALFSSAAGDVQLALYDSNLQVVAAGSATASGSRVDLLADANTDYFLRVTGTNGAVDLRLTNLVSQSGTTVNVAGTAGDDVFTFDAGSTHEISVNGVAYGFSSSAIDTVNFDGAAGNDTITLTGTSGDETAALRSSSATFSGAGWDVHADATESILVDAHGGSDSVAFYDTAGDDRFIGRPTYAQMDGSGFYNYASGFATVYAYSTAGGFDKAYLFDSSGDDRFDGTPHAALMRGKDYEFYSYAKGFDRVYAYATAGGTDLARLYDSSGNDRFDGTPKAALMRGENYEFYNYAKGFDRVYAYATAGGTDLARLYDSSGNDRFDGTCDAALMRGENYEFYNYAKGFDRLFTYATAGGTDSARLYDSTGNDRLAAFNDYASIYSTNYYICTKGFADLLAVSQFGGNDTSDVDAVDFLFSRIGDWDC